MSDTQQPKFTIPCQQPGCKNLVEGVQLVKRTCFECKRQRNRDRHLSVTTDVQPQT